MQNSKKILFIPLVVVSLISSLLIQGCGSKDPNSPKFVVAEGKGVKVTRKQLDEAEKQFLSMRGWDKAQIPAQALTGIQKEIAQQLVMKELLLKKAGSVDKKKIDKEVDEQIQSIAKGMGGEKEMESKLKEQGLDLSSLKKDMEEQFIIRQYIEKTIPLPADPTQDQIKAFYDANLDRFNRPEVVRASHILIRTPEGADEKVKAEKKKEAEAALARVKKGEDFAAVSTDVSDDPGSAAQGGDLGFFGKGQMVPEFDKVAFSTKTGDMSNVFETPYGYHFLKVTDKKSAGTVSLEEATPQIKDFLINSERAKELQKFLENMEKDSDVKYHLAEMEVKKE